MMAGPGEFDGSNGNGIDGEIGDGTETVGVRFSKGDGTETEPEYMEGFR